MDAVADVEVRDRVMSNPARKTKIVVARAASEAIVAGSADQDVVAFAAEQTVVASAAVEHAVVALANRMSLPEPPMMFLIAMAQDRCCRRARRVVDRVGADATSIVTDVGAPEVAPSLGTYEKLVVPRKYGLKSNEPSELKVRCPSILSPIR